jgi:hypothetical protein
MYTPFETAEEEAIALIMLNSEELLARSRSDIHVDVRLRDNWVAIAYALQDIVMREEDRDN